MNSCCFMPLSFEMICYVAIQTKQQNQNNWHKRRVVFMLKTKLQKLADPGGTCRELGFHLVSFEDPLNTCILGQSFQ